MNKPYIVALRDARQIPAPLRITAEVRFVRELERILGDEAVVARGVRAWTEANEYDASELDAAPANLAARWPRAMKAATKAGLRELNDIGDAHFEVTLNLAVH